jgi:hypothetical protein
MRQKPSFRIRKRGFFHLEPLSIALKNAGSDVWWGREIRGGDQWRQHILA